MRSPEAPAMELFTDPSIAFSSSKGRTPMADDKSKQDARDRSQVAGGEDYEVQYFADKNGVTPEQTRELIARHGNDRDTLEREAAKIRTA